MQEEIKNNENNETTNDVDMSNEHYQTHDSNRTAG